MNNGTVICTTIMVRNQKEREKNLRVDIRQVHLLAFNLMVCLFIWKFMDGDSEFSMLRICFQCVYLGGS